MKAIKKITKTTLNDLRPQIEAALKALGQDLGIEMKITNGQFTNGPTGQFKLELAVLGEDGKAFDKEAADFKQFASLYKMKSEWLGERIDLNGKTFEVTGLFSNKPKNCGRIKNLATGNTHMCPAETIIRAMASKEA